MLIDPGLVLGALGVIGVPAAIGLTMAATTRGEFLFVRCCFIVAAALTIFSVVWLTHEMPFGPVKLAVVGAAGAIATIGLAVAWDWVSRKETDALPKQAEVEIGKLPEVKVRLVYPDLPALVLDNVSDQLAREIKWSAAIFNLDDPRTYASPNPSPDGHDPLPIPVQIFDFLRPHSSGGPTALFSTPLVAPHIKPGNKLFGSISVVCPNCVRGHTYVLFVEVGKGGWYSEVLDKDNGELVIPRQFKKDVVIQAYKDLDRLVSVSARVSIP